MVTVKAVSQADPTKSASVQVSLNPVTISILPGPVTIGANATQAFTANVQYAGNSAVAWSVADIPGGDINTVGSISDSGLYTAPASVTSVNQVTIKAALQTDGTKFASVQLTLSPPVIHISPETPTVGISKTKQFLANLQYADNPGVTWQVNQVEGGDDINGHISTAGLYTAPATVPSPATVTVTAIPQADPSQSASTVVTITAATGNSYYVATAGSDSAAGTLSAPWKTISHAAAATSGVKAGDTVYVRGGVYKESVVFAVSGAASPGLSPSRAIPVRRRSSTARA